MKRILFTTDFDKNAPAMLKYTALLAKAIGASITMFHGYGGIEDGMSKVELLDKAAKRKNSLLQLVKEHLPVEYDDILIEYMVDEEVAVDAIIKVAAQESIDLVVMGMKNSGHTLDAILESTTLEVLLDIDCSVLVIPNFFETERINRLGCTTDFEFRDIAFINRLLKFGNLLDKDVTIHCLHVFKDHLTSLERVSQDMETLQSVFEEELDTKIYFEIQEGKLADAIKGFAITKQLNLVVMNAYQGDFIKELLDKGLSKEVAMNIRVPLLILKNS